MKKFKQAVFMTTIGLMQLSTIFNILLALLISGYAFLNIKPYINLTDTSTLGIMIEKGLPLPVAFSNEAMADSVTSGPPLWMKDSASSKIPRITKAQTNFTIMNAWSRHFKNDEIGKVREVQMLSGTMSFETKNAGIRILLSLPTIIYFIWIALGTWKLSKLLHDILDDKAFSMQNYRRIRSVGFLFLEYEILMLIYKLCSDYWFVIAQSAERTLRFKPDFDFSFTWIAIGLMLIIISLAFKTGDTMKQEQELTI